MKTILNCKRLFTLASLLLLISQTSFSQFESSKQIFKSPKFEQVLTATKTVAILPFNVSISYKKMPKGVTVENINEDEKKESFQLQEGMFTYLLRKREKYSVIFQEVNRTNVLLRNAGMLDRLNEVLPDSLCKILGVDAVIQSDWNYAKTGSEAGAIASSLLLGVSKGTGSGQLIMKVYGAADGDLAWRMSKEMNEGAFSSANELMERMMRKVDRNFPFEK